MRGTDRSRVLVDTEQVVLVTDDETTHSESKKVLESLRYEGRWKNSSRRGARRAVFSRMHLIELVISPSFFCFPSFLREGKCLLNPRAYAQDDARRNAPKKSNEANEKTPQGVSHVLRWMAGRVARPNPAKDYVWNASDPTDDLSPLLDMEDILGDDEDMTDRE